MAATDPRMKGLKRGQREIAEEVQVGGEITLRQVADKLNRSTNGVSQSSSVLFERKLIEVVEDGQQYPSMLDYPVRWIPPPRSTALF